MPFHLPCPARLQGPAAFLDDVWKLSTKDWSWTKVDVKVRACRKPWFELLSRVEALLLRVNPLLLRVEALLLRVEALLLRVEAWGFGGLESLWAGRWSRTQHKGRGERLWVTTAYQMSQGSRFWGC